MHGATRNHSLCFNTVVLNDMQKRQNVKFEVLTRVTWILPSSGINGYCLVDFYTTSSCEWRWCSVCSGSCTNVLSSFCLLIHFLLKETQHKTHCAFPGGATAGGKSQTAVTWNISS